MAVPLSVMAALSDITQILNNSSLSDVARAKRLAQRRGRALADHLGALLPISKSVTIDGWTISIDAAGFDPGAGVVELTGVVALSPRGLDVGIDPHRLFVNPPLLFPDDANGTVVIEGRGTFRVDPAAAVLNEIVEAAKNGGP